MALVKLGAGSPGDASLSACGSPLFNCPASLDADAACLRFPVFRVPEGVLSLTGIGGRLVDSAGVIAGAVAVAETNDKTDETEASAADEKERRERVPAGVVVDVSSVDFWDLVKLDIMVIVDC